MCLILHFSSHSYIAIYIDDNRHRGNDNNFCSSCFRCKSHRLQCMRETMYNSNSFYLQAYCECQSIA